MSEIAGYTLNSNHEGQCTVNHAYDDVEERSCCFRFCKKFNEDDVTTPSWSPPKWQLLCPYPYCPSFRQYAQILALLCTGFLLWGLLYGVTPYMAALNSQLMSFVMLSVSAYIGGVLLLKLTTLPALIGMLLVGILYENINIVNIEGEFSHVTSELRKIALVIILTRAGLSLDKQTLQKLYITVLKLGLLPWIAECIAVAILTHYFLNLPWDWSYLLSSIIASVSPAVVVPCFIRLRSKGYGVAKGIPTIVLAAATIDDTTSIAIYGIISSIMFTETTLTNTLLQGPISIIGGIGFGILWGYFISYVPEKNDTYVAQLRIILLFLGGYISVMGSNLIGYSGAGPLAVISSAFVANMNWTKQGWISNENPATSAFRISWIIFEPILFSITGTQVKLNLLDPMIVGIGTGCLFASVLIRIVVTIIICFGSNFNFKEKVFIGLSWMAKATVQAALGPLALDMTKKLGGTMENIQHAETVLMICILSIILTAPIGAILISITGPKLLSRTFQNGQKVFNRRSTSLLPEENEVFHIPNKDSNIPCE